jgi:hypothetical protein
MSTKTKTIVGIAVASVIGIAAAGGSGSHHANTNKPAPISIPQIQHEDVAQAIDNTTATVAKASAGPAPVQAIDKPAAKVAAPTEPTMTAGQRNALQSAHDYLDSQAFSKQGLIEQLSSSAGEGFSVADATYAANHVGANWNEQAVKSAKDYLSGQSFSRQGLIEQLSSSAGEKFTQAQAQYGVSKAYH